MYIEYGILTLLHKTTCHMVRSSTQVQALSAYLTTHGWVQTAAPIT